MASQLPAGALVDAIRSKGRVAAFSIATFAASALLFALFPVSLSGLFRRDTARIFKLHLGARDRRPQPPPSPAMPALGRRLGRNARFASIGNGIGAALMGACGLLCLRALGLLPDRRADPAGDLRAEATRPCRTADPRDQLREGSADRGRRIAPYRPCPGRPPAADLRRLRRHVHTVGRGDAADRRRGADQAGGRPGQPADRRLYRAAADRGRGPVAADGIAGRDSRAAAGPAAWLCHFAGARPAVRACHRSVTGRGGANPEWYRQRRLPDHGAAGDRRHRRPVRPFQPGAGLRRLHHRHRRRVEHNRRRLGDRSLRRGRDLRLSGGGRADRDPVGLVRQCRKPIPITAEHTGDRT